MANMREMIAMGISLAVAVLAAVMGAFVWISLPLLVLAVLLFAWALEPKRTEAFVGRLPYSNYLLKALVKLDLVLPGRASPNDAIPSTSARSFQGEIADANAGELGHAGHSREASTAFSEACRVLADIVENRCYRFRAFPPRCLALDPLTLISARRTLRCRRNGLSRCFAAMSHVWMGAPGDRQEVRGESPRR
jgi:hypothetical protein